MSFWGFIVGVGIFIIGINVGILWVRSELEEAADLLRRAKMLNYGVQILFENVKRG